MLVAPPGRSNDSKESQEEFAFSNMAVTSLPERIPKGRQSRRALCQYTYVYAGKNTAAWAENSQRLLSVATTPSDADER